MRSGLDHTVLTANTPHLHLPVIHVPNYMDHYSFTDPWEMDGWVGQGTQHAALYIAARCEKLAQGFYTAATWPAIEPRIYDTLVRRSTSKPPSHLLETLRRNKLSDAMFEMLLMLKVNGC